MKYLCLAYGDEKDWLALPEERRAELLQQDEVLRQRGDYVAMVGEPVVVSNHDGNPTTTPGPFASAPASFAGIGIVEADSLEDVVALVAQTPCAVAGGAVEIRPLS